MKYRITLLVLALAGGMAQAQFIRIQDENQYQDALKSNKNMVVEFAADWCSVCNGVKQPFQELSSEPEFQQIAFAQVDVDKLDGISKQNGVVGVPTFVYLENGSKKVEEIGVQNMPAFKDHFRQNIRKTFKLAQNDSMPMEMESAQMEMAVEMPSAPAAEPNMFMKFFYMIKDFIMMIFLKIKEFFMMIINWVSGLFGK
jgi:thiol-disulfide isomerase/thioredoxin